MRIGVDVGGTNTDAVLMDGVDVVAWTKTPTTPDVGRGMITALQHVLDQTQAPKSQITAVMIGTTHFTNAVVERRRLLEVAAARLGLPATEALPPFVDWPKDLAEVLGNHVYLVHGGHEFDGREIALLNEPELRQVAANVRAKGLRSIAISSVFAPVNASMEERAAEVLRQELPDALISLSNQVGRLGLLERENATIMNASLRSLAHQVARSFREALAELDLAVPFYISQNDGTLMTADYAERYPVLTFASGPTNSMRGAAFLSGPQDAMVVDVGGTTSDVGMLVHGFPREASIAVDIGGVRTNFRMPDVLSFGLGGGSLVRQAGGGVRIGPDSVGYELTTKGRVFGGEVLTTTDIAVGAGTVELGGSLARGGSRFGAGGRDPGRDSPHGRRRGGPHAPERGPHSGDPGWWWRDPDLPADPGSVGDRQTELFSRRQCGRGGDRPGRRRGRPGLLAGRLEPRPGAGGGQERGEQQGRRRGGGSHDNPRGGRGRYPVELPAWQRGASPS